MSICPHCATDFPLRRADQVYCTPKCRIEHYHAARGDGALRGTITAVRRLTHGRVSVTLRFPPESADYALRLVPGETAEVVGP